jgi:F0F1-type ATP synthase membrane subunit b/b'
MCNGFGGIITQDGRVMFCEPDKDGDCSHSQLLKRLDIPDNTGRFKRSFVRFEFQKWTEESFRYDEDNSLPGWVNDEHKESAVKVFLRVAPARAEYEKVRDTAWAEYEKVRDTARAEYEKVRDTARAEYEKVCDTARAEYEKVRAPAWAEYEKVCDTARAEYEKVRDTAWAEYEKVRAPARAEYEKVCDTARAEYEKVHAPALAEFITTISTITGYVPDK